MSQPPLTMYIFQPILFRPIGMMNTSASLSTQASQSTATRPSHPYIENLENGASCAYARPFNANCENATPLARIE